MQHSCLKGAAMTCSLMDTCTSCVLLHRCVHVVLCFQSSVWFHSDEQGSKLKIFPLCLSCIFQSCLLLNKKHHGTTCIPVTYMHTSAHISCHTCHHITKIPRSLMVPPHLELLFSLRQEGWLLSRVF